ncbi:M16 family metallopeptidase [Bacteroidota bacterium]
MYKVLDIKYEKHILDNGLEVILYQDKSLPVAALNIWYKVGSANEKPGKTGFAHLFEHMMFQGSENVPKEKHFKYIQEAGGRLNGSTNNDRTNYYETVPSNNLEMILWLESDRMGYLLPALTQEKLENQKDVVMNERRQRYENQPYGLAWEKIFSNLYPEHHPYHWPTIGWMTDIEKYELDDVSKFFKTYYAPNNASLVLGGDFEVPAALELIKKYFGNIPNGNGVTQLNGKTEELTGVKKIIHEDNVQLPRLFLVWHSDKLFGNDDAALDILSDVLTSSKNSRLHKSLVFEKQIAQDISSFQYSSRLGGSFIIVTTAKPGVELHTLREEIFSEISEIAENGINEEELIRAKNSMKSSLIYSLQNIDNLIDHINHYNCNLGEPNSFVYDLNRYEQITQHDVIKCIKKYLEKPFIELNIIPKTRAE